MRWIGLAILGIGGVAVLVTLGVWQLARLDEKRAYIAQIEAGLAADPVPLPDTVGEGDAYRPVEVAGTVGAGALTFVHSATEYGLVVPLEMPQGPVLADLGLIDAGAAPELAGTRLGIAGNLALPAGRETALRLDQPNAWTQRHVPSMARALDTRPILVVAREVDPQPRAVRPFPITTDGIPNNHLGYAIQWFGIAAAWAAMAALLGWRMAHPSV